MLENILMFFWIVLQLVIAGYLVIPPLFVLLNSIMLLCRIKHPFSRRKVVDPTNVDFAIVITAHQDTRFVIPLLDSIEKQSYGRYTVYVVADDCRPGILSNKNPKVEVLYPATGTAFKNQVDRICHSKFQGCT